MVLLSKAESEPHRSLRRHYDARLGLRLECTDMADGEISAGRTPMKPRRTLKEQFIPRSCADARYYIDENHSCSRNSKKGDSPGRSSNASELANWTFSTA